MDNSDYVYRKTWKEWISGILGPNAGIDFEDRLEVLAAHDKEHAADRD